MKNYILLGHAGSYNRGCEAIVKTTSALIKRQSIYNRVILASNKYEEDIYLQDVDEIIDAKPRMLNKYSFNYLTSALLLHIFKYDSLAIENMYKAIISGIKKADVCLSIGGDNYCYGEMPILYELNKRSKSLGKKLVLWGASIGKEDISEKKIKDLCQFDLIITRESLTYELIVEKKINNNVKLYPDPAFALKAEVLDLPENWPDSEVIGLNISPLVYEKNKGILESTIKLVEYILKNTKFSIVLVPHVIKDGNNDYLLLKEIYEYFNNNRIILLDYKYDASQLKGFIARTKMFIGARTHATIAAYSSCVPTMVLGYSVKSRGIAKDIFGKEKLVLNLNELSDSNILIRNFNEMMEEEACIRKYLTENMPDYIKKSYETAQYL